MFQVNRSIMTHRRLVLFKWLMVFLPSVTVSVGHSLLDHSGGGEHTGGGTQGLPANLLVTFLGVVLTYIFVEILFRVLWRLQAQALAREQDIQHTAPPTTTIRPPTSHRYRHSIFLFLHSKPKPQHETTRRTHSSLEP